MAADIEAKPSIFDRSREAADILRIGFEDFSLMTVAGKFVAGS